MKTDKAWKDLAGTSLVAQWLRPCVPNAGGPGSIPGQGTRSHMHAATKSSHATTKEPACRNWDPVQPNKQIIIFKKRERFAKTNKKTKKKRAGYWAIFAIQEEQQKKSVTV